MKNDKSRLPDLNRLIKARTKTRVPIQRQTD